MKRLYKIKHEVINIKENKILHKLNTSVLAESEDEAIEKINRSVSNCPNCSINVLNIKVQST